ncbi:S41 family peptidase [Deinococcus altitudinis]|uniref:S41 family peptidase n=1 Tax=Deinococcus altitudinis TaxID=468914 RepID=UPI003891BF36
MTTRMIEAHTGYLRPNFERLGSVSLLKQVFEAMTTLQEQGMTRLVLDLRGNQGGVIHNMATMADIFLHQGFIVRLLDRDGERKVPSRTEKYPQSAMDEREDFDVPPGGTGQQGDAGRC